MRYAFGAAGGVAVRYAFVALLVGCIEVPSPLVHEPEDTDGSGGSAGAAPLPVCGPAVSGNCARLIGVEAGGTFTCGRLDDGTLRCFGFNDSYQLGDPSLTASGFDSGIVAGISASAEVALGQRHACGLEDGALWCWGDNALGQLGTGDYTFGIAPRHVLDGVLEVGSRARSTCARDSGGVACWGILFNGQAWVDDDQGDHVLSPTRVPGLEGATRLSVGSMFACALLGADDVRCWGRGALLGQLGTGMLEDSAVPQKVAPSLATPVHMLAAGSEHVCALGGDPPRVQCWGLLPAFDTSNPAPADLSPQPDGEVVAIGSGWRHSCALLADGRVQCWGLNPFGELGHGGGASAAPVTVTGLSGVVDLAVGFQHNCALLESGDLACWGRNDFHQLGNASDASFEPTPVPVIWP